MSLLDTAGGMEPTSVTICLDSMGVACNWTAAVQAEGFIVVGGDRLGDCPADN